MYNINLLVLSLFILLPSYSAILFLDKVWAFKINLFSTFLVFLLFVLCKNGQNKRDFRQPWVILLIWNLPYWLVGSIYVWNFPTDYSLVPGMVADYGAWAQFIVLTCFTFIFWGYVQGLKSKFQIPLFIPKRVEWKFSRLNVFFLSVYPICLVARFYYFNNWLDKPLYQYLNQGPRDLLIGNILTSSIPIFLLSVYWLYFYLKKKQTTKLILVILTIFEIIWGICYATSKFRIVYPFFAPIIPYWIANGRVSKKWILVSFMVLICFAYPYVNNVREIYFGNNKTRADAISYALNNYFSSNSFNLLKHTEDSMGRLAGLGPLIQLEYGFDQGAKPLFGYSYLMSVIAVIPRYLWPSKPMIGEGQYFTAFVRGSLDPLKVNVTNITTSTAPTMLGSIYWNFMWFGLIIHLFMLGYFSAILYKRFYERNLLSYPGGILIYCAFLSTINVTETEVSYMFANIVQGLILAYFTNYLFSKR